MDEEKFNAMDLYLKALGEFLHNRLNELEERFDVSVRVLFMLKEIENGDGKSGNE